MKIRRITATIQYCNSGRTEERTVTCLFDDISEQYELTKVFVVEFNQSLVFSKNDQSFLVND
ncbi:hypothetical protein IQ264_08260 [Phormidium sp. LEGE 05292]|uniref:Uncharacterized protein n=1 Tax=Floridaenema evergladense BLCC-F167 TaxID=3153639 RepID=A0ABV4WD78_9CYAN|nr:hypothetical protein [Phormidium sp. LEGE 05292]MBE9225423.1 hypothetical protein [Phormidium sp. LEGE 05292]